MRFGPVVLLFFLLFNFSPIDALAEINMTKIAYDENLSGGVNHGPRCMAAPLSVEYSTHPTIQFFGTPTDMAFFSDRSVSQTADTASKPVIHRVIQKIKTVSASGRALLTSSTTSSSTALLFGTGIIGLIGISRKS